MKQKFSEMTLARLESSKTALLASIKKHEEAGNEKLVKRYWRDLVNVEKYMNLKKDQVQQQDPKLSKKTDKEFQTKFNQILHERYNPDKFHLFVTQLRRYLQDKLIQ
jgi:hypothetical protein